MYLSLLIKLKRFIKKYIHNNAKVDKLMINNCTMFNFINKNHFIPLKNKALSKKLLSESVNMVEIEVFSFCNRRCYFCPNSFIDRHSINNYMDEAVYLKILNELSEVSYNKLISYSRYNEPLADRIIFTRLKQAREILPNATLHLNTNGDYLTFDYLQELYESGLRSINIQVYPNLGEKFDEQNAIKQMNQKINDLKLEFEDAAYSPNDWMEKRLKYKDMQIKIYARNFDKNGCSRGNTVDIMKNYVRSAACMSPFRHIYIDYNCNIMPCCNLRSDLDKHHPFIVGNVAEQKIFEVYTGEKLVQWRKNLIHFSSKQYPCRNCSFCPVEKPVSR